MIRYTYKINNNLKSNCLIVWYLKYLKSKHTLAGNAIFIKIKRRIMANYLYDFQGGLMNRIFSVLSQWIFFGLDTVSLLHEKVTKMANSNLNSRTEKTEKEVKAINNIE